MKQNFRTKHMNFWNKLVYDIEDNADFMNATSLPLKVIRPDPVPIILICVVVVLAVLVIFLLAIILFKYFKGQAKAKATRSEPCHV